eukprot:gene7607-9698_t
MKATKPLLSPFIDTAINELQTPEMRESIRRTFENQGQLGVCRTDYRVQEARLRRDAKRLAADLAAVAIDAPPGEPIVLDAVPLDVIAPVVPLRVRGAAAKNRVVPELPVPVVPAGSFVRIPEDPLSPIVPLRQVADLRALNHERPVLDMTGDSDAEDEEDREPLMSPILNDVQYYNYESVEEEGD